MLGFHPCSGKAVNKISCFSSLLVSVAKEGLATVLTFAQTRIPSLEHQALMVS